MFDIPKGYETKMAIVRAIYELLQEGCTIESATVTEICERAHVSRKTRSTSLSTKSTTGASSTTVSSCPTHPIAESGRIGKRCSSRC